MVNYHSQLGYKRIKICQPKQKMKGKNVISYSIFRCMIHVILNNIQNNYIWWSERCQQGWYEIRLQHLPPLFFFFPRKWCLKCQILFFVKNKKKLFQSVFCWNFSKHAQCQWPLTAYLKITLYIKTDMPQRTVQYFIILCQMTIHANGCLRRQFAWHVKPHIFW